MQEYHIIGVMSGTSLDGVDLAHCSFSNENNQFTYTMNHCITVGYDEFWKNRLKYLQNQSALEYAKTHTAYGRLLGTLVKNFAETTGLKTDYVASHGHTIFHAPHEGYTSQVGEGAALAAVCGIPVICDFRTSDVGHGGQGAPLVPAGDELLFGNYTYCLNIGGFANISFRSHEKRIAFDICPANFVLNQLAEQAGLTFDNEGRLAAGGQLNIRLLEALNSLAYYHQSPPKSLGREWVEQQINPILQEFRLEMSLADQMHTFSEHIAIQIGKTTRQGKMILTGGGAYHQYLVERIRAHSGAEVILPERSLIEFKEALIFAFLGYLRLLNQPNCLASVTGASKDSTGGAIYLP